MYNKSEKFQKLQNFEFEFAAGKIGTARDFMVKKFFE